MVRRWVRYIAAGIVMLASCRHEPLLPGYKSSNYPPEIGKILVNKCAVSGCHNDLSYQAAAGLNLTTWNNLFNGANSGSVVIPYRPDYSSLCFFTNTDTSLGVALQPTMPIGQAPLSKAEYLRLTGWIVQGAPSATGKIMFSSEKETSKFYVTNRMCDVVTVFDSESLLQSKYIDVGVKPVREFPYCIKVSPDKKYWYVSFYASSIVQKFSTANDQLVANIDLGAGLWTSFEITTDSKYGYFVDNSSKAKIAYVELNNGAVLAKYTFGDKFSYISGIALNEPLKKMYVGNTEGNFVYSIGLTNPLIPAILAVPVDGSTVPDPSAQVGPGELIMESGSNRCFIACLKSGEIKVIDMETDKLQHTISLGTPPAFMAYSPGAKKLFVSCPDDETTFPGNRGSVIVIDAVTNSILTKIKTGYQPYGLAIDEVNNRVIVVNANISSSGPGSHHASRCGEKNGNVSFIDLQTLKLLPRKREVAVFPFGVAVK